MSQTNCDISEAAVTEYRIWNTDMSIGVLVDYEDYIEAIKYRWNTQKPCKKNRRMGYMRRTKYIPGTTIYYEVNGEKRRHQGRETVYLHVWVLERSGKKRPPGCYLADHKNNDIYDCRRANLEWGTSGSNNKNRIDMKTGTVKRGAGGLFARKDEASAINCNSSLGRRDDQSIPF